MTRWNPAPYTRIVLGDMAAITVGVAAAYTVALVISYRRYFGDRK